MTVVPNIIANEVTDIDGWSACPARSGKSAITVLGGYLGQLMIVLNALAKEYSHLDKATNPKSPRESREQGIKKLSTPVQDDEKRKSQSLEAGRKLINATTIQNFIYTYIGEKLKTETLPFLVDHRFEDFLLSLSTPLALNQMRTMKEPNYSNFRKIISKHIGNPVLQLIRDNQEDLGLDPEIFKLVYEGFWDLYTFKPAIN